MTLENSELIQESQHMRRGAVKLKWDKKTKQERVKMLSKMGPTVSSLPFPGVATPRISGRIT